MGNFPARMFDDQRVQETIGFYPPIVRVFPSTNPGKHVMMRRMPMFDLKGWMRTPPTCGNYLKTCAPTVTRGTGPRIDLGLSGSWCLHGSTFLTIPIYTLQYRIIHLGQFGFGASIGYLGSSRQINSIVWKSPHLATDFFVTSVPAVKACFCCS